jgi:hypothetical protein
MFSVEWSCTPEKVHQRKNWNIINVDKVFQVDNGEAPI